MSRNSAYILFGSVLALISIGLVILTSVSVFAPHNHGNPNYFVIRQAAFLGVGILACGVMARWDYHHWVRFAWAGLIAALLLMGACFLPVIGAGKINGAYRWLQLGFTQIRLQPVELAKLALVASIAWWFGFKGGDPQKFVKGMLAPLGIMCAVVFMCVLQQDLGTSALLIVIVFLMLFVAGARMQYIAPVPVVGFLVILFIALTIPQRVQRLTAFLDPEAHKNDSGGQVWNALVAFGSGGMSGLGLGEGVQKMRYLPEAHTDFIFPNIGEELGLIVTLSVVLCFLLLALSGGCISCHAPDTSGVLLGVGATALICLQAAMNMAVVTSLMPPKGIGLPFISYGGSNLVLCLGLVGILFNIHSQAIFEKKKSRGCLPPVVTARM